MTLKATADSSPRSERNFSAPSRMFFLQDFGALSKFFKRPLRQRCALSDCGIDPNPQLKETRFEWLSLLHHREVFGFGRSY